MSSTVLSPSTIPTDQTAIGFLNSAPDPVVPLDTITIPEKYRLHAMVLGSTGSGKSTTLKLLIRQNLLRGDGVAILDPHHDLAAWSAMRIPRERSNQLVYISPAHLERTGKCIPINPLEGYRGAPAQAATEFAETLLKAFETKGVQMHQILREAATSLIAAKRGGMGMMRRIILDKSARDEVLANVNIQENLDFWERVFERMPKEAATHVDNKLTPITSNPAVGPFFEGSTVFDMQKLMEDGGILIFDGAGCNSDGERMLFTTFLLNLITTSATALLQSRPQGVKPRNFYLYVDEMQMLESGKIKEMLQQVRKMGIRMTLATQQLEAIDKDNISSMVGNCDLYMVSKCTLATAKLVATKMGVEADSLVKIPQFHMNFHMSLAEGDIHGSLLRTRNMDGATRSWETLEEIVDRSLHNYGIDVDMDKYTNQPSMQYGVTPLEMAMLCILFHKKDGLGIDEIHQAVARFGPAKRRVAQLLNRLAHSGLVEAVSDGGAAAYRLRPECIDRYFDTAALKGRAGGEMHIATISALLHHYTKYGYYCRMDVGGGNDKMADLVVCEPAVGPHGEPDLERWGRRVAVEVETGPGRHPNKPGKPGQVYVNWEKSRRKMTVWFLAYSAKDQRIIHDQLGGLGVGRDQYECSVISDEGVLGGSAIPLPPGFDPVDALPHCDGRAPLDVLLLGTIPPDGIPASRIRAKVPDDYSDRDIADAVDRLKKGGLVEAKTKSNGRETLHRV